MIDCREATRLNSTAPERPLTLGERFSLALHLALCPPCRYFRRQMAALRTAARGLAADEAPAQPPLGPAARERLRERLRKARDES
ncbi:MAG: zf-HC2 domain-containing protein [Gammaproteobacteria bacterium]